MTSVYTSDISDARKAMRASGVLGSGIGRRVFTGAIGRWGSGVEFDREPEKGKAGGHEKGKAALDFGPEAAHTRPCLGRLSLGTEKCFCPACVCARAHATERESERVSICLSV